MGGRYIITVAISLFISYANANANNKLGQVIEEAKARCPAPMQSTSLLYANDFKWGVSLKEIDQIFNTVYRSGKRLAQTIYYDHQENTFILPYHISYGPLQKIRLKESFIKSVIRHIEESLRLNYSEYIIFSDMGHSHILIPEKYYEKELNPIPISKRHLLYEKMLAHPEIKILYHTAEQLKMTNNYGAQAKLLEDSHLQWRYYTRNLVGDNKAQGRLEIINNFQHSKASFNTAYTYLGYRYWGGGFNMSSSKDGCFAYSHKGKKYYFDISLKDLEIKNGHNSGLF